MANDLQQSSDDHFIPMTSIGAGKGHEVASDLYYYTQQIVNVIFIGEPSCGRWVMVDAGMPKGGSTLLEVADKRFPDNPRPEAIILTHGHFDHVGGIVELLGKWDVPVYAHPLERPYLDGTKAYPDPDPTVEGGMLATLSSMYPVQPVNIEKKLIDLPLDGSVPGAPGWVWMHTPGHSPGHVSLFRKSDMAMIAGDAFVTVRADSMYKTLVQKKEVNGPPRYLTTDWEAARKSVRKLQELHPLIAITGHGQAMTGGELQFGLRRLVDDFDEIAIPDYGRYVPDN